MTVDLSPRFTLSLRGYDKDEVDEYLESLVEHSNDVGSALGAARERIRQLEERLTEVEARDVPSGARMVGDRVAAILQEAEAAAADAVSQAQAQAEYLLEEARQEADTLRRQAAAATAEAREALDAAQRSAEDQLQRAESEAKGRASAIIAEGEARARRRQAQIEGWAQEVIQATQADQARLAEEFVETRRRHEEDLNALTKRRDEALATLRQLHTSLTEAIN